MIAEKIYALCKKSGLSQEQLASELQVSRQAVSKWESGASVPETDKLIALSAYFHVSLDELIREEPEQAPEVPEQTENPDKPAAPPVSAAGLIISIAGIAGLMLWGLIAVLNPAAAGQLSDASVIQINGSGLFLAGCAAAILAGAVLLMKGRK